MSREQFLAARSVADLIAIVTRPEPTPLMLTVTGMSLLLVGCAKAGDTMPDSRRLLRELISNLEPELTRYWDHLRNVS